MPNRKGRHQGQRRVDRLTDDLINCMPASFPAWHIREPRLIFAGGKMVECPKTGLTQFGPAALDRGPRQMIRVAIIGSGETVQAVANWIANARGRIPAGVNTRGRPYDPMVSPDFPGFNADSPFACEVDLDSRLCVTLTKSEVEACLDFDDFGDRVSRVVTLLANRIAMLAEKEPAPDVVICAMPTIVEQSCGPVARRGTVWRRVLSKSEKFERRLFEESARTGQGLFSFYDEPHGAEKRSHQFRDFHNALKAHAMQSGLPTQLIWESTLRNSRENEDPATTAWNFFTALYYKAGNVPWELQFSIPRTCFVGITFYRESPDPQSNTRTCLAQAFSETGEGLVLRGERVTWDKERDRRPHLSRADSESILRRVIELYTRHFDGPPRRIVLHKTSRYWPEELEGFKAAIEDIHSFDFLAIERRGIRFVRLGQEPPIRGTVVELGDRDYLVYTRGYIPFYRVYPGMRIPNPLEVVEHHGDSSAQRVCSEILALTKLNWNTCAFSSRDPVTILFSRQVATILKELPDGVLPQTKYRYYI